jgi:formylglycine-generating enzyme required for sulfatase activity
MTAERARLDGELMGKPADRRRWFVNSIGQTLAVVGRVEPADRLAIATTETTMDQYGRFDRAYWARARRQQDAKSIGPDLPAGAVSFDDAARFCNWLSEQEGFSPMDWCYLPGDPPGAMVLAPDFVIRRGYRLPTLREWEHAARAGTISDRYFGRSLCHASAYAWSIRNTDNHAEAVGRRRPNDLGLFDVLGNLLEWCHNPDPPHDVQCDCPAAIGADCRNVRLVSVRGGSYSQPEGGLTVAAYSPTLDRLFPNEAVRYIGFRVVRLAP